MDVTWGVVAALIAGGVCFGAPARGFERNEGQCDARVKFMARGPGYGEFATGQEVVTGAVRMRLPRAVTPEGEGPLPGKTNYLGGGRAAIEVRSFARIRYREEMPGIDLVLRRGENGALEYDWVVRAGGDPASIRMRFEGVEKARVDGNGDLVLRAGGRTVRHRKPAIYQERDGVRETVAGGFRLAGRRTVRFEIGGYDKSRALVIDPVVDYAIGAGDVAADLPYIEGGYQADGVVGVAVDKAGNAYIAGNTYSPYFPAQGAPFQGPGLGLGPTQVFVAKVAPDGRFVYTTLFNRSGRAAAVAIDASGSVYFTGTASANISTAPVSLAAGSGMFVAKLDPTGTFLEYNAYLSGGNPAAIAVDGQGEAFVAGTADTADLPVTAGAFQAVSRAIYATGFALKLNAAGTAVAYATYLGGSGNSDAVAAMAVDAAGDLFLAGQTSSPDFPVTPGAFQTVPLETPGEAMTHGFVTKLSAGGSKLIYSTFLEGSVADNAAGIAIDAAGNAYVTGNTSSADFPATAGAYQANVSGGAFVAKLNPAGSQLVYSTIFSASATASAIAIDPVGNAYITGSTGAGLPVANAVQWTFNPEPCYEFTPSGTVPTGEYPCQNAFAAEVDATGGGLVFSTYLNGYGPAGGTGVAIDGAGNVYLGGSGELSVAGTQTFGSNGTAFLVKLGMNGATPRFTPQSVTNGASFVAGLPPAGGLATIFLSGLPGVDGLTEAAATPLPLTLAGVSVSVGTSQSSANPGGVVGAPLLAVVGANGQQQINFQVPYEVGYTGAADVMVTANGVTAVVTQVNISTSPPGVFKVDATHGAIEHSSDYSAVTPGHPAAPGEIVIVYATGLGTVTPVVNDGVGAPLKPLSTTDQTPAVTIGGQTAEVLFSGLAPGKVGLYQLNVRVPKNAPAGEDDLIVSFPPAYAWQAPYNFFSGGLVPLDSAPVKISVQ